MTNSSSFQTRRAARRSDSAPANEQTQHLMAVLAHQVRVRSKNADPQGTEYRPQVPAAHRRHRARARRGWFDWLR